MIDNILVQFKIIVLLSIAFNSYSAGFVFGADINLKKKLENK